MYYITMKKLGRPPGNVVNSNMARLNNVSSLRNKTSSTNQNSTNTSLMASQIDRPAIFPASISSLLRSASERRTYRRDDECLRGPSATRRRTQILQQVQRLYHMGPWHRHHPGSGHERPFPPHSRRSRLALCLPPSYPGSCRRLPDQPARLPPDHLHSWQL